MDLTEESLTALADSLRGSRAPDRHLSSRLSGSLEGLSFARQLSLGPLAPPRAPRSGVLADGRPGRLAQLTIERAEGNPFFLEELARAFRDHDEGSRPASRGRSTMS